MGDWVDYKQIKTQASFKAVVEHYQLDFSIKGDELVGTCPLPRHAGDRNNKNAFHVSLDKNCYNRLTHCGGGNVIDFVRLMENQLILVYITPGKSPLPKIEQTCYN